MMSTEPTLDPVLVHRAQQGDKDAIVALYRRYVNEIFGYAYNQLGDTQDAEDLTSEIFIRVVNGIHAYRSQSSFRTWLYAIAHNQVRDHWRRNGRQGTWVALDLAHDHAAADGGSGVGDIEVDSDGDVDVDAGGGRGVDHGGDPGGKDAAPESNPNATRLGRAVLEQLPPHYRQVLRLRIMDGRSVRDTADELGITENHVKVLQHRALKRAAGLAGQLDGGPPNDA